MLLLHRMSLLHKFLVFGCISLVAAAVPTTLYVARTSAEIDGAQRRVEGAAAMIALQDLVRATQNHRDILVGELGVAGSLDGLSRQGNAALASQRPAARDGVEKAIAALDRELVAIRLSEAALANWNDHKQRWAALDESLASQALKSSDRSTKLHSDLVVSMLQFAEDLLGEFELTLAAHRDIDVLVEASLVRAPWVAEMMGRLRAHGTAALVERHLSPARQTMLIGVKGQLQERLDDTSRSVHRAYAADDALREALEPRIAAMYEAIGMSIAFVDRHVLEAAQLDLPSNEYYRELTGTIDTVYGFNRAAMQTLSSTLQERVTEMRLARRTVLGVLAALAAGCAALMAVFVRSVTVPVGEALELARSIADGDLDVTLRARGDNEIGRLVHALGEMRERLAAVVSEVRRHSESVAVASAQIAQGNSDLSSRTEEQASSLQQTAASMEELGITVQQNADNARQADELARGASQVAHSGGKAVGEVVATMKEIHDSSKKISDIIAVIDAIAFQTNILALNAAVEAARAGEQGRGFAVVAAEVRNLAQRSAEAAREIKGLIGASVERVDRGTLLVDRAGATMKEVVSSIQRVSDIMGEISSASAQQSAGVAQVGEAVTQMDQVTQQNAALVEESAAATAALETQAQQLLQAVSVFRLANPGRPSAPGDDAADEGVDGPRVGVERRSANRATNVARLPQNGAHGNRDPDWVTAVGGDNEAPRSMYG